MSTHAALLTVSATLLVACATVPRHAPRYSRAANPPAGSSNVYVYRIGAYPILRTPTISIDGKAVFDPAEGSYTVVSLPAGQHRVKVDWAWDTGWPDLAFPIDVDAEPLYIKISGSYTNLGTRFKAGSSAWRIEPAAAEVELAQCCRYVAPKN